jgi:hypothetical protein
MKAKMKENPAHLLRLAGLNRRLSRGAERVLDFVATTGGATPEIIAFATGYSLKTLEKEYIPELQRLRLVKYFAGTKDTLEVKTNLVIPTELGMERTEKKRRKASPMQNIFHRLLIAKSVAYLWRQGAERQQIMTAGLWKNFLRYALNIEDMKGLPTPDAFYVEEGTNNLVCIEAETGRSWKRLEEKILKYNRLYAKHQDLYVIFVIKNTRENETKRQNFIRRFEKVQKLAQFVYKLVAE